MTETGWIIVLLVAGIAIVLAVVLLRRKDAAQALPHAPVADDLLPEQVTLPVSGPEPDLKPEAGTSFPQEPLAHIIPPVTDVAASVPIAEALIAAPIAEVPIAQVPPADALVRAEPVAAPRPPAAPDTLADAPIAPSPAPFAGAEPISVSTPPAPSIPVPVAGGDNLLRLKGVGPKIATLLTAEGITRYAQIAAWTDTDLAAIDAKLGGFAGRPKRDHWVDQAQLLAAGDVAGYEAKYGKL
ncbi:MAG TPA: hypothetical protein VF463_08700 [Sphingobium sp.]